MLLWFLLFAAVATTVFAFDTFATEIAVVTSTSDPASLMWPIFVAVFILDAILVVYISRRKNWARIILLIFTIFSMAVMLWPDIYSSPLSWDWWVSNMAFAALELLALYWLFTGAGAAWFSRRNEGAF
jgi:hypothetical protein